MKVTLTMTCADAMTTDAAAAVKASQRPRRRLARLLWWVIGRLRPRRRLRHVYRVLRMRYAPLAAAPVRRKLFPLADPVKHGGWTFRDENWVRVVQRDEHRRLLREGRALTVVDNEQEPNDEVECGCDGSVVADLAVRRQAWVWLYLDPAHHSWRNFRWEFTARRDSDFRELQFGFRYQDFYNRYRFRHEDNHLHFDIALNGGFRNSIHRVPFRMNLGQEYCFAIEARDNRFALTVDGVVQLDEVDRQKLFPRGSVAVILWENDGKTPIKASVSDISVVET